MAFRGCPAEAIEFYAKEHGFRMVQLQANMHAYRPDRALDWLRPALRKCADLGLLVKLHTGDGLGQAGVQRGGARDDRALLADLGDDAEHDVVDHGRVEVRVADLELFDQADHQEQCRLHHDVVRHIVDGT